MTERTPNPVVASTDLLALIVVAFLNGGVAIATKTSSTWPEQ